MGSPWTRRESRHLPVTGQTVSRQQPLIGCLHVGDFRIETQFTQGTQHDSTELFRCNSESLVKLRVMRAYMRHSDCRWYETSLETALEALARIIPGPAVTPAVVIDNPDTTLFALEVEMRIWTAQKAMMATRAQTAAGIVAKLCMVAHSMTVDLAKLAVNDTVGDQMLRNTAEDAVLFGSLPALPDADLQTLWREYRQNSKEWDNDYQKNGEENEATYASRAAAIVRRIIATPSESVLGLAIKLRVAADNFPEGEEPEHNDDRALASALNDADRLAGFTEPQRVWRAS